MVSWRGEHSCARSMVAAGLQAVTRRSGRFAAVFTRCAPLCHHEWMRSRTFWFLTLPTLFVAETTAHTVVARALDPANARHGLTSHLAEAYGPQLVAVAVLLAGALLGRRVIASFRADGPQPLPDWRL